MRMLSFKLAEDEMATIDRAARLTGVPRGRLVRIAAVAAAKRLLEGEPQAKQAAGRDPVTAGAEP